MEMIFYHYGEIRNDQFHFAVICSAYKGKWIYARHKERTTWEIPGGHREENEDINLTASRELFEETGAVDHEIEPVCDYSVTIGETTTFGRLFHAKVKELGPLPNSEICEIRLLKTMPENLTYKEIQPLLQQKVLQYMVNKTLGKLEEDKNRNISIINFIKNYVIHTIDTFGASVLIRGRSDEDWIYISSKSEEEFQQLIQGLDKEDKCFAVLEDWMVSYIVKDREIQSRLTSVKLIYDFSSPLPAGPSNAVSLSETDASYIYEYSKYKEYISIEYIEERIKHGIALGIFENNILAAWIITHDDGAIGFLNVLEEYRGKGYATDVTMAAISRLLDLGEVPFIHIEEENKASMRLASKAGFRIDRRIHWIKLK